MQLRDRCARDSGFRKAALSASRESFLWWINAWGWTYRQKRTDSEGRDVPVSGERAIVPFVTWPVQDEAVAEVLDCIRNGRDVNFEKSRDMGASWLLLALADWFFLFRENVNIGAVSRKEELVDKPGDMDSLFEKIRFMNRLLPTWMMPDVLDRYMFMHNRELDSTISGESTNADVGRGGRKTWYLVDEAAAIRNGRQVEDSLSQNTPCQIWASTPHGPNTAFHVRIKEGRGAVIRLPWWRHPEKAVGARQIVGDGGAIKWTSPWYERQCERFSKRTVAQEIDIDHGQAGDMFFDYGEVERHRSDHQHDPIRTGKLVWVTQLPEERMIERLACLDHTSMALVPAAGPWRFWLHLEEDRPPQYYSYVFGIDISNGAGASNSVITVLALEIRQVVAKFWDAFTSPEELAVLAATAGVWFGGKTPPAFICWENNGPGGTFGRKLTGMGYPSFYRQRIEGTMSERKTDRWGWHSNTQRKEMVLGGYRDALRRDDVIQPCKESLDECEDYIYDPAGRIIPATLRDEPAGGHSLHGDHVIADALAVLAASEFPNQSRLGPVAAPAGSFADRKRRGAHRTAQKDLWLP